MKLLSTISLFLLFILFSLHSTAQICHPDDFDALLKIRAATNGTGGLGSWNSATNLPGGIATTWTGNNTNVSNWHGIDTAHDASFPTYYRIRTINLDGNLFSGTNRLENSIPDSLFVGNGLALLDSLILSNNLLNDIDGNLSGNTTSIPVLNYIDVSNNNLTTPTDSLLFHLTDNFANLQTLKAASALDESLGLHLRIINNFPPNFQHLDLSSNGLTGGIPLGLLEDIPTIVHLDLSNNNLEGRLPKPTTIINAGPYSNVKAYGGLSNLEHLNLASNNFRGAFQLDWFLLQQLLVSFPTSGNNMPFEALDISGNNFNEITPNLVANHIAQTLSLFNNRFSLFKSLNVAENSFDFIDLFRLKRFFRLKQISLPLNDHYVPQGGSIPNDFLYNNQDSIGIGGVKRRNNGDSLEIRAGRGVIEAEQGMTNVLRNRYSWERTTNAGSLLPIGIVNPNGTFAAGSGVHPSFAGALGLLSDSTQKHKLGIYNLDTSFHHNLNFTACVTNDSFPNLTLCLKYKKVEVGACTDDAGRPIQCQTMMVQFDPDTLAQYSSAEQDSFKQAYSASIGATPIATCVCGDLELWEISDTASTMIEAFGKGTTQTATTVAAKPQLLSAEPNYALTIDNNTPLPDTVPLPATNTGNNSATTIVAIIDAGIDYNYTDLLPYLSEGASLNTSCMQNATWGYNFLDDTNNATDDHGHGTAIAGIIAGLSQQNIIPHTDPDSRDIGILPLKYTNKNGEGTLFNAACAMYYAADYERTTNNGASSKVRVINNSWGYYGAPSDILERTLNYVGEDCGILVVNSAGNDGTTVEGSDSLAHWPSNSIYDPMDTIATDNIISVAALDDATSNTLSTYSNYGATHIDLAANGSDRSTLAGTTNGLSNITGTSFATAQVSRAAAILMDKYPDASYFAVKYALTTGVDRLQSSDSSKLASKGRLNFQQADAILNSMTDRGICSPYFGTVNTTKIETPTPLISIFPNPTAGNTMIRLEQVSALQPHSILRLFSSQGQLVQQQLISTHSHELNLTNLPQGIYLLQIQIEDQFFDYKLIKH